MSEKYQNQQTAPEESEAKILNYILLAPHAYNRGKINDSFQHFTHKIRYPSCAISKVI